MSFNPLVDQFATDVKTAVRREAFFPIPKIGHYRLARWQPFEAVCRNWKTFRADVFAKCEERVMALQIIDRRFYSLVDLDLFNTRIAPM